MIKATDLPHQLPTTVDVVGAGGIGICLAIALHQAGCRVQLIESSGSKLAQGNQNGIQIAGFDPVRLPMKPFQDWNPNPNTPIFLCVKGYHTSVVLEKIPPICSIIPIQNGFDQALAARAQSLEGIASWISECDPNVALTRITRRGDLHFGPAMGKESLADTGKNWLKALAGPLKALGIRARFTPDVRPYKSTKLIYNAAISPIASATGFDNSRLLTDPMARHWFFALLGENIAIMRSRNIPLAKIGPFMPSTVDWILRQSWLQVPLARFFAPSLRGTYCSMALDFAKGITELDHYNGHLIRLALEESLCPVNRIVVTVAARWLKAGRLPHPDFLKDLDREATKIPTLIL